MRPEIRQLPHRRAAAPARGRIRAAGAREGARARHSCPARWRSAPTAACCGGCCRTSSPTRSNTRRRAACWSAAGGAAATLRIDVYDTGLGIPASKKRVIFREFHRLDEGAKVARGLGLGLSIVRAHRARARPQDRSALGAGPRLAFLGRGAAVERRAVEPGAARAAAVDRGRLAGMLGAVHRQRAEDPRRHGRRCSAAGAARC